MTQENKPEDKKEKKERVLNPLIAEFFYETNRRLKSG